MTLISSSVVVAKNRQLAITGALSALIILMGIPGLHLGYIPFFGTTVTIIHVPVILAAILGGLPGALVTSFIFGLTSLVNAAANPVSVLDPMFVNPLCSILPRLLFGAAAWILFKLFELIPHMPKALNAALTALISTCYHSFCVFASLFVFANNVKFDNFRSVMAEYYKNPSYAKAGLITILVVFGSSIILEACAATIFNTAVVGAISVSSRSKSKLLKDEEKQVK